MLDTGGALRMHSRPSVWFKTKLYLRINFVRTVVHLDGFILQNRHLFISIVVVCIYCVLC